MSREDELDVSTIVAGNDYEDAIASEQEFLEERPTSVAGKASQPKAKARSSEQPGLPGLPSVTEPPTRPGTAPLGSGDLHKPVSGGQSRKTMAYNVNDFREERTTALTRGPKRTPDRPTPVAPEPIGAEPAVVRHASSPDSAATSSTEEMTAAAVGAVPTVESSLSRSASRESSRELSRASTEPHFEPQAHPHFEPQAHPHFEPQAHPHFELQAKPVVGNPITATPDELDGLVAAVATPAALIVPPTAPIAHRKRGISKRWFIIATLVALAVGSGAAILLTTTSSTDSQPRPPAPTTVVADPPPPPAAPAQAAPSPATPAQAAPAQAAPPQAAPAQAAAPTETAAPTASSTQPSSPQAPAVTTTPATTNAKPKPAPASKPSVVQRPKPTTTATPKPAPAVTHKPATPAEKCTSLDCF
jgi:hypothetical protein